MSKVSNAALGRDDAGDDARDDFNTTPILRMKGCRF